MTKLKFKKLDSKAVIPFKAHPGDIGLDVTAIDVEYDQEHDVYIYHTGLACEMEEGYALLCLPRSSNTKTDAYLPNSPGLVDPATYRGEIQFRYKLRDSKMFCGLDCAPYKAGERIGQFVIVKIPQVEIEEVDTLSETSRGTGGFGSSGK